MEETLATN